MTKSRKLQNLFSSHKLIRVMGAHNALSAKLQATSRVYLPKVNSFIPGRQELASIAEFVGKILAAKNAQNDPDFLVIARGLKP